MQEILKNQIGLSTEYSEYYYNGDTEYVESLSVVEDITVLGYPLDFFLWRQWTDGVRAREFAQIVFEGRPVYELLDEPISELSLADIVHTLTEQFGSVDFVTYEICCVENIVMKKGTERK